MRSLEKICAFFMALPMLFNGFACEGLVPENWLKLGAERMNAILDCLEQDDVEGLKEMFSKKAVAEAEKLDETLTLMTETFNGTTVTEITEDAVYPSETREIEYGKERQKIILYMDIETTEDAYVFFFVDYPWDKLTPENEGLYTLRMVRKEDEETEMDMDDVMEIAGAYVPGCGLTPYVDTARSLAEERSEILVPILKAEDESAFKALFAKNAQEGLDGQISTMFAELELTEDMWIDYADYYWKEEWLPDDDTLYWSIEARSYNENDEEAYVCKLFVAERLTDADPDNVGVTAAKLLFGEEELYVDYWSDLSTPGVYVQK